MIEPVFATTAVTLTALALVLTLFGISALIVGAVTFSNYISGASWVSRQPRRKV